MKLDFNVLQQQAEQETEEQARQCVKQNLRNLLFSKTRILGELKDAESEIKKFKEKVSKMSATEILRTYPFERIRG